METGNIQKGSVIGMLKYTHALAGMLFLLGYGANQASALDGAAIVAQNCVSCHNVTGPAPSTFKAMLELKAPDLFYAGSKFKKEWLVEWIQNPTSIRPSGVMFLNNIAVEDGKDRIKTDAVETCPASLTPEDAMAVADYLMTLTDSTMKVGVIDPAAKFRKSKAVTLFTKRHACVGCHKAEVRKREMGGVSGPDLRHAGRRLNPDWIYALIDDPQHWNPMTWMPRSNLSKKDQVLLTQFIAMME